MRLDINKGLITGAKINERDYVSGYDGRSMYKEGLFSERNIDVQG